MNTKLSLSKRIRKVFSMNNLRSSSSSSDNQSLRTLNERNGSNSSISSYVSTSSPLSQPPSERANPLSFRRRSIASLSSLFQKGSSSSNSNQHSDTDSIQSTSTTATSATKSNNTKKSSTSKDANRRHSSGDLRSLVNSSTKKEKRPELRVDTTEVPGMNHVRKGGLKGKYSTLRSTRIVILNVIFLVRSSSSTNVNNNSSGISTGSVAPDSPNSVISSRSFTRLPPPQQQQPQQGQSQQRSFIHLPETGLPSPTPSTSSSTKVNNNRMNEDEYIKMPVGLHYTGGLGLHGSPKLRPASSSTSSLVMETRRIQFCSTIQVHETFAPGDYDRRCDTNATCQKLTPIMAMKIKQELNEYKLTDMEVHVESRQYTHFFL